MQKYTLLGEKRTELGRKVRNLRKSGFVPATVYGKGVKSHSIRVSTADFQKLHAKAGNTGLIELSVDKNAVPVLIHRVQVHPVTDAVLHIEFHQVDLKEKVHANIPVVLEGESPAVAQKLGVLLTIADEIEVEALPTELPEKIAVDVSGLSEVNNELRVSDLRLPKSVEILTPSDVTIVKVGPLAEEEVEVKPEAAPVEGGEQPTEEEKVEATEESKEPTESAK